MRIDIISDLHMYQPELDGGDLLICAGDWTFKGDSTELAEMGHWLEQQCYKYRDIVYIAGNHDWGFERDKHESVGLFPKKAIYLNDSSVIIQGLKIHGSPIQPEFCNWAFNRFPDEIKAHWDMIPEDADIVVTHGPPKGILDLARGMNVGCPYLLDKIMQVKPKLHIFGHIHEGYGIEVQNGIYFINASLMNRRYKPVNKVITMNI